jgi:hypothetical protein
MAQKADEQVRHGIQTTAPACDVAVKSQAVEPMATAQTDADSLIGGNGNAGDNWNCSPPSTRRSSSFGQRLKSNATHDPEWVRPQGAGGTLNIPAQETQSWKNTMS